MADSNVTSLFRGTAAHSPSMAALARESDGTGPVDFCIPCNPYFPTPAMFDEMAARLREIITYYPSSADTITAELCNLLQLPPQCVAMGNGSTELITWIDHLMVRESLAIPVPTFGRWTDQPMETGKRVDMFPLQESNGFALDLTQYAEFIRKRNTKVAVICNPNNPDGGFLHKQALVQFMDSMADLDLIVIDESFLEFADAEVEPSVVQEAMIRPNVIVLRSLGKNFGLHGIRFGYLVANPALLAGRIRGMLPKWNLNAFAEHVVFILREHGAEYAQSLQQVRRDRLDMASHLSALPGLTVYPSQGNFLFVRLPVGAEGTVVRDRMLTEHRILVRECGNKIGSSSRFLRLVVRPQTDVRRLVSGMEQVLYGTRRSRRTRVEYRDQLQLGYGGRGSPGRRDERRGDAEPRRPGSRYGDVGRPHADARTGGGTAAAAAPAGAHAGAPAPAPTAAAPAAVPAHGGRRAGPADADDGHGRPPVERRRHADAAPSTGPQQMPPQQQPYAVPAPAPAPAPMPPQGPTPPASPPATASRPPRYAAPPAPTACRTWPPPRRRAGPTPRAGRTRRGWDRRASGPLADLRYR